MMGLLKNLVRFRWSLLAVLALAAWEGYLLLKPKPTPLDEPRQKVAEEACWQAVRKLPQLPPGAQVAVLRLVGDRTGYVTDRLRAILERSGACRQPEPSMIQRAMKELQVNESEIGTAEQAVAAGKGMNVPFVLSGRVSGFHSDRDTGRICLELTLADVPAAKTVSKMTVAVPGPADAGRLAWHWRALIWAAVVAVLPLVTWPVVRKVLSTESNPVTAAALLVYSLAAWVLAYALAGFAVAGWAALLLVVAFLIGLAYNYLAFCLIERYR